MARQLQVVQGPDQGRVFPLPEEDVVLLGRSRAIGSPLTDPYISRVHCQVQVDGGRVLVTDYESAGGTFVNNQRLTQPQPLQPGDVIRIGETHLRFLDDSVGDPSTLPPAMPTSRGASGGGDGLAGLTGQMLTHYEVGPVLAHGQSGLVFHGRDTLNDFPVALKVLWPEFGANDAQRQRFVRAMETMLPLTHLNLVNLFGAGQTGPYCWAAMEYVEGESLTQVVQRLGTLGMLDWRNALRVAVHVARALDYAHRQQIVHRNVTPMNILVQAGSKTAKLGDLMLAKALEGDQAQVTRLGERVGNLLYLSPEATHGSEHIDARSDYYSLGATVYVLLTGRPPFEGKNLTETITLIRQAQPVRPKKYQLAIPDLFEGTVLKMLAKRPEDRFQKSGEMLADLERVARFQGLAV